MDSVRPPQGMSDWDDAAREVGPKAAAEILVKTSMTPTAGNETDAHFKKRLEPRPFKLRDPSKIPKREWIYGRHYIRKFVSATVAPGGAGKTSLSMVEAVAMASGRSLLGIKCEPCRVWVFNLEDPYDEIERRIAAICLYYGIKQQELDGRLYADSGRDKPLVIAEQGSGGVILTPDASLLTEQIKALSIDVLMIDPFISSHRVSENDNTAIDLVAKRWAQIAHDGNCAIDLSHHVRKSGASEPSIEDARGAKALIDAARSARRLVRMTDVEATRAGIEPGQAWRYSREGDGKENLAPPDRTKTWRKLESVELGNGDNIGVMTAWKWPDPFSDVRVAHLEAVRRLAAESRYRESSQAADWFGKAVAQVLKLDIADKQAKAKVLQIIKRWIANGEFEIFEAENEARQTKKYIRPIEREIATPSDL